MKVFTYACALLLAPAPAVSAQTYQMGSFQLHLVGKQLHVSMNDGSDRRIWESSNDPNWLTLAEADLRISGQQGRFDAEATVRSRCTLQGQAQISKSSDTSLELSWSLQGDPLCIGQKLLMSWQVESQQRLGFTLTSTEARLNLIAISIDSPADEGLYGMGLQPSFLNLKGLRMPIIVQEQGIARGRQPFSALVNAQEPGAAGTSVSSYMAAPQFITSRNRGFFLENTEYAEIDSRDKRALIIRLHASTMRGQILAGETPLQLIEAYTEYAGRMKALPDWFHSGAIVGLQGGTQRVRQIWQELQTRKTPVAGFWLQDWEGKRTTAFGSQLWWNWELDRSLYSNWEALLQDLAVHNIRVLGYINPHLVDVAAQAKTSFQRNLYAEASQRGYLLKNARGEDFKIKLTAFDSGLLDLSQPEARSWIKQVMREQLLDVGLSGWMCDFSEAYPFDAVNAAGIDGARYHNQYPVEWARIHQELAEELGRDDLVSFCRAGHTRSPAYARLFWQGDQMVTWDREDGLKSAVIGLIGGGLSGFSLNHSDIGGYTTLATFGIGLKREKELLLRWMELSAFTAAFRTHEGNLPAENIQFYSDQDTLDAFAQQAKLFTSLFSYRQQLFEDSEKRGYPLVRTLFLHYPEEPQAWQIDDQFLLGSDILVAPVIDKGSRQRLVYFPKGKWVHVWTGQVYGSVTKSSSAKILAPLGQPPAFYAEGSATGQQWIKDLRTLGLIP